MSQARALSSDEVRGLREELASGATPTVWFTASAVGVPEGRSGKVTALDDSEEGDFIQVRPAGSKDVLSFSAGEVTLVKPQRKRKESQSSSHGAEGKQTAGDTVTHSSGAKAAPGRRENREPGQGSKNGTSGAGKPASERTSSSRSRGGAVRRKTRQPMPATVTLTADEAGQWSVEVTTGKKRVLRPMQVPASAVGQATKVLHNDVAEAVEPLLEAAREQQRARVEQLQQELAEAQRALEELAK